MYQLKKRFIVVNEKSAISGVYPFPSTLEKIEKFLSNTVVGKIHGGVRGWVVAKLSEKYLRNVRRNWNTTNRG